MQKLKKGPKGQDGLFPTFKKQAKSEGGHTTRGGKPSSKENTTELVKKTHPEKKYQEKKIHD